MTEKTMSINYKKKWAEACRDMNAIDGCWGKKMESKSKRIADLEECLAGFMLCGAMNGMYISPEMETWCKKMLKGRTRTPAQIWRDLFDSCVAS